MEKTSKQKTVTILLLATVLVVWGFVGYRFVKNTSSSNELIQTNGISFDAIQLTPTASFKLSGNYNDPFLSHHYVLQSGNSQSNNLNASVHQRSPDNNQPKSQSHRNPSSEPQQFQWSGVKYLGLIRKKSNPSDPLVILSINGVERLLHTGEESNGIKVERVHEDSVILVNELKHERSISRISTLN